jgi:hypothetical protein
MAYYNCEKCNCWMHVRHVKPRLHIRRPICPYCHKKLTPEELAYFDEEPIVIEETIEQWETRIRAELDKAKQQV